MLWEREIICCEATLVDKKRFNKIYTHPTFLDPSVVIILKNRLNFMQDLVYLYGSKSRVLKRQYKSSWNKIFLHKVSPFLITIPPVTIQKQLTI